MKNVVRILFYLCVLLAGAFHYANAGGLKETLLQWPVHHHEIHLIHRVTAFPDCLLTTTTSLNVAIPCLVDAEDENEDINKKHSSPLPNFSEWTYAIVLNYRLSFYKNQPSPGCCKYIVHRALRL